MMKILHAVILFSAANCFSVHAAKSKKVTEGSNLIQTYANVSAALGKYFSSACIYLVTHSDEQDMLLLTMTSKYISSVYVKPNVVTSFTDYYKMINSTAPLDRCYVPMQVILDPDDDPLFKKDFSLFSQKTSMHGTDQYGGGVWLLFLKSFENDFVDEYFRSIYLPFDVELIVAWIDKTKNMVHLKEAYRVVPSYPLRQPYLGNWTTEIGLRAPRDPLHYSRRTDLEGLKMNVGYVDYPPITIIENEKGPTEKQLTGYFGDIWKVLEDAMNATSVLEESEEFGEYLIESDKWTGLLGEIKYNRVDVAVADFILTRNRFEHMDYSFPLIVTTYQIFYQFPGSKSDANSLFLPLSYDIWVTLGAWLLIGTVVLYTGCHLTDKYLGTHEHFELNTSFFCILGALSAQGANDIPKITSSRILFFLTHMIGSVLVPTYSASLISYLTVTPTLIPFTTLGEFYLNGQYKMTVRKGSYEGDIFAYGSIDDKYVKMIYDRDIKGNKDLPKKYHDALPMMCSDKYKAFFGVDDTMQWILDKAEHQDKSLKNCMVTKMQKDAGKVTIGMVFPKKSHFKGLVNHHIRNFQSIGIMERLRKKYWTEYDKMLGEVWSPVNVASIIMMYVILGAGVGLGLVLLFLEKIVGAYRKQHPLPQKPEMFKIQNGHHGHHGHQNRHHGHQNGHHNGHFNSHQNGHQNGYERVTSPRFGTTGHFHHNLGEHIRDLY